MRLSPWLERAVAYLILSHPDQETVFNVEAFNEGQLYLDLCSADANEIWEVGTFRGDQYVTAPASFMYEVPPTDQEWPHLYLAETLTFTPTADLLPASWRIRWVEAEPEGEHEEWVAEQRVLLTGSLAESGELRANIPYLMYSNEFHLYWDINTLVTARPPFCKWFFDIFLLQLGTVEIYNERTYLFFKDTFWPPPGDVPNIVNYPPVPDFCVPLSAAAWDFDSQGGTFRNRTTITFPIAWTDQDCNMVCVFRDRGDHGNYVNDWLYFFIGRISEAFIWRDGLTPCFGAGDLVFNVA